MTTFTIHTADSAPADSKEQLETTQQRKGLIPNLYGVLAEAPIALEAYETLGSLLISSFRWVPENLNVEVIHGVPP